MISKRFYSKRSLGLVVVSLLLVSKASAADAPLTDWVDPKTGHRVVRLSREPGSASLYFHQYPFSADGKKMVFTAPSGIWSVDLETHKLEQVVKGRVGILLTGRKSGDVYYIRRKRRDQESVNEEYRPQGDIQGRPRSLSGNDDDDDDDEKEDERREGGRRQRLGFQNPGFHARTWWHETNAVASVPDRLFGFGFHQSARGGWGLDRHSSSANRRLSAVSLPASLHAR